jgi:hypothetical protein
MPWSRCRPTAAEAILLAVVIAIAIMGCTHTTEVPEGFTSAAPSGTPTAGPSTVTPSVAPAGTAGPSDVAGGCPTDLPSILVDQRVRYRLCMPEGWRDLGLDRSAWIEAFGTEGTPLEIALRGGTIDHVVASLPPADHLAFAPLVIDSQPFEASETLEDRRDTFLNASIELGAVLLSSDLVDLDGVRAARAALDVSAMEGSTRDGLLFLYLVPVRSELLFIRFTTEAESAREYEPIFDAIAGTLDLGVPGA